MSPELYRDLQNGNLWYYNPETEFHFDCTLAGEEKKSIREAAKALKLPLKKILAKLEAGETIYY